MYSKWKGVGFISLNEKGVLPDDQVFVHWSNIFTDDRYPFLVKGMEVEFGLQVWKFEKRRGMEAQIRAKHVTELGGATIAIQDKLDAEAKTFVGEQTTRFTGILKYYDGKKGMGKVVLKDTSSIDLSGVPRELLVEDTEVNCGGKRAGGMFEKRHDVEVEFGIWKNSKDQFKVYNMTLLGGVHFSSEALDRREVASSDTFSGTICQWWWKQGWGFITPQDEAKLPQKVKNRLSEMQAAAQRKAGERTLREKAKVLYFSRYDVSKEFTPKKGGSCIFQIYIDAKGVGATNIR
jgi:cold shock CspA family protein